MDHFENLKICNIEIEIRQEEEILPLHKMELDFQQLNSSLL